MAIPPTPPGYPGFFHRSDIPTDLLRNEIYQVMLGVIDLNQGESGWQQNIPALIALINDPTSSLSLVTFLNNAKGSLTPAQFDEVSNDFNDAVSQLTQAEDPSLDPVTANQCVQNALKDLTDAYNVTPY